ncbi:LytTR family DNA-binding domain-containing protein [Peptacetobacter hiranonis]|uniref:LytR/AlgR family response regulator transcription factor n=1 Tax=Peptacetobacter hiranonis TaxID=89152 RepID=UPI002E78CAC5|nr:LytTR family DNA-binding domain-containing protein [Peptacetobacter hiranonis]MEE0249388.1 LytTR family DNA-binding domain-containing protein [Peptacetobacter hiranonis]
MINIVICEDELEQRNIIKKYINDISKGISVKFELLEFESAEEFLLNKIEFKNVDIFILDINMNGMSGMDLARLIREKDDISEIIFVTSLLDYIQEGYTVRAYRYLLKPINYEELKNHLLSCINDINKKKDNFMMIENKGIVHKVPINEIMYIEVAKKELTIYAKENSYKTKSSMDKVEKELEKFDFYRCHKSYLVNMKYIETIDKNEIIINCNKIPVSKHRISDFKKKFTLLLGDIIC